MSLFGIFRVSRELVALNKKISRLEQLIAANHQPSSLDAGAMLATMMDGQVKQLESTGNFIRTLNDIAVERMASALGRRGGKARAKNAPRDARGRLLPARKEPVGDCRMCSDPFITDFSVAEFNDHQRHKSRRSNSIPAQATRVEEDPPEAPEPRPELQVGYPLPYVENPNQGTGGTSGGVVEGPANAGGQDEHEGHLH